MKKRKICVVTGSRAEYGLLKPLLLCVRKDRSAKLQLLVTGSHLVASFGSSWREIIRDGFRIDERIPILTGDQSSFGIATSMGRAAIGFAKAFKCLQPDIVVVLGDRSEILAAVSAALVMRLPVAHIAGGDITEGAFDDAIRHAITKMSHLHFVTNGRSAARIRQLGEDSRTVFNVGHLGLDAIRQAKMLSRDQVEDALKFRLRSRNLLITFHPVTLGEISSEEQLKALLAALSRQKSDVGLIFTGPNADPDGPKLSKMIRTFVAKHSNACFVASMGQRLYLNTLKLADAVVGNSSSGIYEAPSMKKPTVNIGDRQRGRLRASTVINCGPRVAGIEKAIGKAFRMNCTKVVSPFGDGRSALRIYRILKSIRNPRRLLKKSFKDTSL